MTRRNRSSAMAFTAMPRAMSEISTLMMMSPLVIGSRLTNMWLSAPAPTASDRAEVALMISEKALAAAESMMAMNMAWASAATEAWGAAATGRTRRTNDGDAILTAGLKPYSKRVRQNRKRLSR